MAETQQTQTEAQKEPWEIDWNPVGQKALETIKTTIEPIKQAVQGLMPWDMDWGAKRRVEAPSPAPETKPTSFEFNKVFNRLIQAETRGVHARNGELTTSPVGAKGITQLMPKTANNPGFGITPVQDNSEGEYLRVGKEYLQALVKEFGGDYRKAVAAYNAGIGNVKKAITKGGDNWEQYLPKRSETIPYLNKILGTLTGSGNASAAADFSGFTSGSSNNRYSIKNSKGENQTFEDQIGGYRQEAVNLIQQKFPQFVSNINTKVSGEKSGDGAVAEYGGLSGDTIKAGRLDNGKLVRKVDKQGNLVPLDKYEQAQVNSHAFTLMHELQHARMSAIQRFDYGLGDNWRDMIKDAGDAGFPSVSSTHGGGDQLNEFLSTATVIHEFKRAGVKIDDNRYGPLVDQLNTLEKKYPWLRQYVVNHIQPEALQQGGKNASANKTEVPKYERKK